MIHVSEVNRNFMSERRVRGVVPLAWALENGCGCCKEIGQLVDA